MLWQSINLAKNLKGNTIVDEALLQRARQLHQNGELAKAMELYQQVLANHASNIEALHYCAIAYSQQEDYEEALNYINQAIEIDSQQASLYNSQGNILLRQQNIPAAIKAYQQALSLDSQNVAAHTNLGRCFYLQENFARALSYYQQAIDLDPEEINALFNLAVLQLHTDNKTAAKTLLHKIIDLEPENSQANSQLGQILLDENQTEQAILHLTKALEQRPLQTETLNSLGQAYLTQGEYDQAVLFLEQCLMTAPKHPEVNYHLATAYLHQGDHGKALNYYLRQNEIKTSTECFYNVGVLLMYQERNKEAIEYLQEALRLGPENLAALVNLGGIYLKLEKTEQALQCYQQALTINPDDKEIAHIIAALDENQNPQQAPQEYLQHLFDNYAPYYDKHLVEQLKFQVPQKIQQALYEENGVDTPTLNILDLGCGTGLSGEALKSVACKLIGIDASPKMLALANKKDIYDELVVGDIHEHIQNYKQIDLVVASDVFTYIGDLSAIIEKISNVLVNNGWLAFSVEQGFHEDYHLQKNIRYQHEKSYLEKLLSNNHFKIMRCDNLILREQRKQAVKGYLIVAKKIDPHAI